MTNSAFPFPIQTKALAVTSDDDLGFHNAQEADDGVPGSPRAERPEFEGIGEGRRAGKREVRTFHCTLPSLATCSTLSMRKDFLVRTAVGIVGFLH